MEKNLRFYQNEDNGSFVSNTLTIYKIKNNDELLLICDQLYEIYDNLKRLY